MLTVLNVEYSFSACCFCIYVLVINFINIHVEAHIFKDQYSKRMEDVNSCVYLESFGDLLMFFRLRLSLYV